MKPVNCPLSQGYNANPGYYAKFKLRLRNGGKGHEGWDFACKSSTPIRAAHSGVVKYAGWLGNYGIYIGLQHDKGYGTGYSHIKKGGIKVRVGQRVKEGQVIGYVGSTGNVTGPHLHWNYYRRYGTWVYDHPAELLRKQAGRSNAIHELYLRVLGRRADRAGLIAYRYRRAAAIESSLFRSKEYRRKAHALYNERYGVPKTADRKRARNKTIQEKARLHVGIPELKRRLKRK